MAGNGIRVLEHRMEFRHFTENDYDALCRFLIALNEGDRSHINWNWARFEWMFEHPEFDRSLISSIGLWLERERVVGAAIYDMYFGEAFCGVLPGFEPLYPEVLDYAYRELKDDEGLALAICDGNAAELEAVQTAGFAPTEQTETIMSIDLCEGRAASLPEGLTLAELDQTEDLEALLWLFWQGFDHGSDRAEFERTEDFTPHPRKHFNKSLSLAALDATGEPVSYCGLWYLPDTDYAYVEPVCTVPAWRGRGAARALIFEALNRARALGAKRAYVISDQAFYEKLGFAKTFGYTFHRKA